MKKTVLITGSAKRLGKEMAIHLAKQGWNIAIHFHSSENLAISLKKKLSNDFPESKFELFKADLSDSNQVERLIPEVLEKMGKLDLLINNASVFDPGFIGETSPDFLDRQMNINFKTPFVLIRNFAQHVKKGAIINIVDTRISKNKSNYAAYSLSKKALWELTKMAALEFAPGIRVNAIAPGLTLPPEGKDESYLQKLAENIPMKKPGGVEPILQNLDYIIGNDYLTGQLLFADGGENLGRN